MSSQLCVVCLRHPLPLAPSAYSCLFFVLTAAFSRCVAEGIVFRSPATPPWRWYTQLPLWGGLITGPALNNDM